MNKSFQKLSADLELEKAQAHWNRRANQFAEWEIKLINAQGMNTVLQMIIW
jgi:hypothetical protein